MRLLVTGGRTGYLGRRVVAAAAHHEVVAVGSADADVRDPAAVDALVDRHRPDVVVHTAYVQADPEVTGAGAVHVARAAARVGARLVLVSSDVVFGGRPVPYDESATPDPVSAYGVAKVLAETAALASNPDVVVARTSLILGDGESGHERLFRSLALGAHGALFEDERRCPVHVEDLAAALVELAANDVRGVLHLGGADATSRLELGRLVARRDGLDATVLRAGRRADLPDPGPVDVRLDSSLASRLLATRLRGAREFLAPGTTR
ncbi:NAD-dependent epimerase/dehydratase family protein [Nocardioides eburneiflavus]|uniref:NAD-dependent epimerase/dehydratase family protein n=1 Tax=Nocardioides eburneiflavus TaxID=2518372 RepID=A0A4Z1CHN4_9ACTN|nr:sugar nucleotide-binding protein [Nocardioides eburneiflavus]TGN66265.1 NAD-dependent epimerase/dehydratase family protein [Nocardioides eburneiflavus]